MSNKQEKRFTVRSMAVFFLTAVILGFMVFVFSQCKAKMPQMPPVKVQEPAVKKPAPPSLPTHASKEKQWEELSSDFSFAESVDGGVEGGVEGGVCGGVLGAPPGDGYFGINLDSSIRYAPPHSFNTEEYNRIYENRFLTALDNPLSTFSIDVDTGSYSNIRRYLNDYRLPPKDAVRIEEMINYFEYDYPEPMGIHPFSITTKMCTCPWESSHFVLHIGVHGKSLAGDSLPLSNLVFLLDVSGSMDEPDKLPLLVSSFKLLASQLSAGDKVAIVVYAGAAGVVLPSVPGSQKEVILAALDKLTAGGCTAGNAGIRLVGYENRVLPKEDFADDKKDAGELGAGHTVTALYEIIPCKPGEKSPGSDPLRFQETYVKAEALNTGEMALVKLRYKQPQGEESQLVTQSAPWEERDFKKSSENVKFSAAVVMLGMLLRESEYVGNVAYDDVLAYAKDAVGPDRYGYRGEFLHLVSVAKRLKQ
ncbi:MAG: von Willebrand factor type A domain-containing protein [Candidatus Aminicenantes bacterium]|nr:von Willebrand factor type A domain-containing protein [Candidatus Aminicenantes bacterium]